MPPTGSVSLDAAVERLLAGGAVAFPTETVFGLGADATNADAVERVYAIKNRPHEKPMPVIVSDLAMAQRLTDALTGRVLRLAEAFWPGPLTLVCESNWALPSIVTAGGSTVAIRVPGLEPLCELIERCNRPLIAPSANRAGDAPAMTCESTLKIFEQEIASAVVACYCPTEAGIGSGAPSTILQPGDSPAADRILRAGPIGADDIARVR